jgi:hypothetical protein
MNRNDWASRIDEAQLWTHCLIDGATFPRVRFGDEAGDWGASKGQCHDCGAKPGQFHVDGCDVERCPKCGAQFLGCDCGDKELASESKNAV